MEHYRTNTVKVFDILRDLEGDAPRLTTNPEWQRGDVWTPALRVNFIDTVLKNMPVPQITLWKRSHGRSTVVVDGRQRITTLQLYRNGKIPVGKSTIKKYSELSEDEQTRFNDTPILVLEFPQAADEEDICDYFERINAGGKSLSHGELMNNRIATSAIIQEVNKLFFQEDSEFKRDWESLFGDIDGETKRMSHYENTVPYLTSSLRGAQFLTKSYPIIVPLLKEDEIASDEVRGHMPVFMDRLTSLMDVMADINNAIPEWINKQKWKGGLPLIRQIASIWYTIINPSILDDKVRSASELWVRFYTRVETDRNLALVWWPMLRKNAKPRQIVGEVEFALSMI
jgi:hypothetical protein